MREGHGIDRQKGHHGEQQRGGGQASRREPEHDRPIDMVGDVVPPAAGRLGDRGVEQIGADRDLRRHAEARDQQGRHQRAAADAGQADQHADAEAGRSERQQMRLPSRDRPWPKVPSPTQHRSRARTGRLHYSGIIAAYSSISTGTPTERSRTATSCARRLNSAVIGGRIAEIGAEPAGEQRAVEHEHIVADLRRAGLRPGDDAAGDGRAVDGADQHEIAGKRQLAEQVDRRGERPSRMRQSAMSLTLQACAGVDAKVSKSTSAETLMLVTGVRSVAVRSR